jgi:hypothetical protein
LKTNKIDPKWSQHDIDSYFLICKNICFPQKMSNQNYFFPILNALLSNLPHNLGNQPNLPKSGEIDRGEYFSLFPHISFGKGFPQLEDMEKSWPF